MPLARFISVADRSQVPDTKMTWEQLAGLALNATTVALGVDTVYRPKGGSPASASVRGVLTRPFVGIEAGEGARLEDVQPVIAYVLIDLPVPPVRGDIVEVGAQRYTVVGKRPDGEGGVLLHLEEAI